MLTGLLLPLAGCGADTNDTVRNAEETVVTVETVPVTGSDTDVITEEETLTVAELAGAPAGIEQGQLLLPEKMAHNIYMDPDLTKTSRAYRAFQIDFAGMDTPKNTYWALCNWSMAGGFGAYGGLQHTYNGARAIMSFWEGEVNGTMLRAHRVYPYGTDNRFGGEGEGTNYIPAYDWRSGQWYRMLFYCWDDLETGHTFVGQWVDDLTTGKWTLISYFDTNLTGSYITGGLSQFQENYWPSRDYLKRSFFTKNYYVYDLKKADWISLNTVKISYDPVEWGYNTAGTHEFGATAEYFWGAAGEYVADQAAYDAAMPRNHEFTIVQPDKPEMPESFLYDFTAMPKNGGTEVQWKVWEQGAPVITTQIILWDAAGKQIGAWAASRPELENALLGVPYTNVAKVSVTTQDVYGLVKNYEIGTATE